ncbi:MAG: hypothetical protein ACKV2Q_17970, partial [Planctomycetaceae bacterium]
MPNLLRCSQGHEWQLPPNTPATEATVCPDCGATVASMPSDDPGKTVLFQPPNDDSGQSLFYESPTEGSGGDAPGPFKGKSSSRSSPTKL